MRKCCTRTQPGSRPCVGCVANAVPGCRAMNCCTAGIVAQALARRRPPTSSATKPIGSSQSRLNHLLRPTRTRGAIPFACGIEPAHVSGSIDVLAAVS